MNAAPPPYAEIVQREMSRLAFFDAESTALAGQANEVFELCKIVSAMPIEKQADLDGLAEGIREAKARGKSLEDRRKELTGPLLAIVNGVRDWFRPPENAYGELERACRARIARHESEQREAVIAAQAAAGAALQAGDVRLAHAALAAPALGAPTHTAGVSFREDWKFSIEDADAVPRELCSPDPAKIREYAKRCKDAQAAPAAPGLVFVLERAPIVR